VIEEFSGQHCCYGVASELGRSSRTTLNTKGLVAAGRRRLPPVPANRELLESSNSK